MRGAAVDRRQGHGGNTAGTLAGLVGMEATGYPLHWAGGSQHSAGWRQTLAAAALQCVAGSRAFPAFLGWARASGCLAATPATSREVQRTRLQLPLQFSN